jgi:hypothetical protein
MKIFNLCVYAFLLVSLVRCEFPKKEDKDIGGDEPPIYSSRYISYYKEDDTGNWLHVNLSRLTSETMVTVESSGFSQCQMLKVFSSTSVFDLLEGQVRVAPTVRGDFYVEPPLEEPMVPVSNGIVASESISLQDTENHYESYWLGSPPYTQLNTLVITEAGAPVIRTTVENLAQNILNTGVCNGAIPMDPDETLPGI